MSNKKYYIATILAGMLVGCGGSDTSTASNLSSTATFIDDSVSGIEYINGSSRGFTDENGEFPYTSGNVEFYLGKIKLGQISSIPNDNKVFIQDVVGVSRTDVEDTKVLKIATLLQSLDSNSSTDKIEISKSDFDKFEDLNSSIDDINITTTLANRGFSSKIKSIKEVKAHMNSILELHGEIQSSKTLMIDDISIGDGATDISIEQTFSISFTDNIPKEYATKEYFKIKNNSTNSDIECDITINYSNVTIRPKSPLEYGNSYTLIVSSELKNFAGSKLSSSGNIDFSSTFTTIFNNSAPTANAGADIDITEGNSVTLDASASSDSDGTISSYRWLEGATLLSNQASFSKSDFSVGTHNITLEVTDNSGATSSDSVVVTIKGTSNNTI